MLQWTVQFHQHEQLTDATSVGGERRKKKVLQRAQSTRPYQHWPGTIALALLLLLSITASMSYQGATLLPQLVAIAATVVMVTSATATLGSRAAKNLIHATGLHRWYLPPNSMIAKALAAISVLEAAALQLSTLATANTAGAQATLELHSIHIWVTSPSVKLIFMDSQSL